MLKYYIYVSETKVEMLYPQLPPAFLKGAESEFKVNLGVVSTSVKGRGPDEAKELTARVAAVSSFLKDHGEVGTVESPKQWIGGNASMQWGCVEEYASDIAFFGGRVGRTMLGLVGSSESLIGAPKSSAANHEPFYYTLKFFNEMLVNRRFKDDKWHKPREEDEGEPPYYSYAESIDIALKALPSSKTNVEFLALVLHQEPDLIVGSPIYVALAS